MGDCARQLGELLTGRRLHPLEPGTSIGIVDIHAIQEQHVKVDVRIQRTAEALDEGDRTRTDRRVGMSRFLDQVRGNDAVDDPQHLSHDRRSAGEQKA